LRLYVRVSFLLKYSIEGSAPRTPALTKRLISPNQNDNSDSASIQSSNRQIYRRTTTIDNPDTSDNMYVLNRNCFCFFHSRFFPLMLRSRTGENNRSKQEHDGVMLTFDVNEFFSFGSPLSLILAYRKLLTDNGNDLDFDF